MSRNFLPDGSVIGEWWHTDAGSGRIVCDLCPRECHLKEGDRGFCFVRENRGGQMVLSTYGRSTGFCIDPIEKKPLNHFYPGTSVLSFGTAGCNLGCKFCQNWEISKSREVERLSQHATPDAIARAASELGCRSVAFTYNDPVIWAEYAIDSAMACRERGIQSVAVTAGYIHPSARAAFYETIDAANVDLKGFTEDFYWKTTNSHLAPVLDTLQFLKHETDVWFEITNLMIPDANDSHDEVERMSDWIVEHLGRDVPIHFTAFHPDFRMRDRPRTSIDTLVAAYNIAKKAGIEHVYVGNVHDVQRQSTYCPECKKQIIERDGYVLGIYAIENGCCRYCQAKINGCFDNQPGSWGNRRQGVDMSAWSNRLVQLKSVKESKVTNMPTTQAEKSKLDVDTMTREQREQLHSLAAKLIALFVHNKPVHVGELFAQGDIATLLKKNIYGLFTTLKRGKQLRGCCGLIGTLRPLGESLLNACQRTAIDDRRMPAISPTELPYLNLDISLLEGLEPIQSRGNDRLKAFEIGKHGLQIQRGQKSGLLLPSVSIEQEWNAREFLQGVCRKAGLEENDWLLDDCHLQRFAGSSIHGEIGPSAYAGLPMRRPLIVNAEQLTTLQQAVTRNLMALGSGATPSYFVPNAPEGTVHGIVLSLFDGPSKRPLLHLIRLSMRPGIPLQSSLYELTTGAYQAIQNFRPTKDMQVEIALTILHDPSAHGYISVAKSRLDTPKMIAQIRESIGIEGLGSATKESTKSEAFATCRAIIALADNEHVAVSFDPTEVPGQQIIAAIKALGVSNVPVSIFTMDAISTRPYLMATNAVAPEIDAVDREPAVAGKFYPAEDTERRAMVRKIFDDLLPSDAGSLSGSNPHESSNGRKSLLAIMTPHAGLTYSGRVAAMVWREVAFPRRLLIIGPKHTQQGVAWAVAPQSSWKLSESVRFKLDVDLAASLAQRIDGMQLDVAAHRREHGVEVQLPILEYLSPNATFAAIAMHGATWPAIQTAASQLASLLADDPDPPLLVISSDMNHYASELENRRRDRIALDAILAKDPRGLIDVCQKHEISMCGLIPAALVMQTLAELDIDYNVQEVAYATSGDTIKSDRVVGYAGLTFSANSG